MKRYTIEVKPQTDPCDAGAFAGITAKHVEFDFGDEKSETYTLITDVDISQVLDFNEHVISYTVTDTPRSGCEDY